MKKRLSIFSCIIGLCLLAKSCVKEGDLDFSIIGFSDNFVYDFPIPLIDSRLTLGELLKNIDGQHVIPDDNGLLRLIYQKEFSFDFSDLGVFIPNQQFSQNFSDVPVPPSSLFPADSIQISHGTFQTQLVTNDGIRIDSARVQRMNLQFEISTGIRNQARFVITSPNIVDASGNLFTISMLLPGTTSSNQGRTTPPLDLSNYYIIPDNSNPSNPHALRFNYTITIFRDTLITEHFASSTLSCSFENIDIDYAYGYFGRQVFGPNAGGIDLPIFERFPMDLLEIETANMTLTVTNGLGIPVLLDAEISTLTRNPSNPIKTFDTIVPVGHSLNPLTPVTASFQAEIQDLINDNLGQLPYRMEYSATVTTNPDDDQTVQNFVSKNSFVKVGIGAEVPMRLRVEGLVVSDTIAFAGLPFSEGIEFLTIRANLHNGFPLDAAIFLYLLDSDYQIIDSIWAIRGPNETEKKPLGIVGAVVNPITGHVDNPSISQLEIPLNRNQIESLVETRYFKIKGILSTSDHENNLINIFSDSGKEGFLHIMIGCRLRISGRFISSFSDFINEFRNE